jgi:isoleucyl-tRNA synthetase
MPFEKVETQVDFPAQERAVLRFWDEIAAFDQLRQKNQDGPRWSFLDGPITANNPMGVHHAWGRTYKDAYQRYHAMLGQQQRYQNGFDCQGLWVEVEVEKELKLSSKRDIENLVPGDPFASIDRFVQLCKARVDQFARVQTEQSIRLGYWMNWDRTDEDWAKPAGQRRSYFTMSEENNYTIWTFLKKCHQRGLIYRGYDAMPWCPRCGVGLSEMEVKEGYKMVEHRAVFVKFPLVDRPGENLLVWTTTPWTLTSNVAAAVNPELTYEMVKFKGEVYYVARGAFTADRMPTGKGEEEEDEESGETKAKGKGEWLPGVPRLKTLEQLFKEKDRERFSIVGKVKGAEMVGWKYHGPFDDLPATAHPSGCPDELARVVRDRKWADDVSARDAHRVVAWDVASETEGTGIVHIAPGCGKEDFLLGKDEKLPPVAPLDESGVFLEGFGELTGKSAVDREVVDLVCADLTNKDRLFATERYVHRYPHCWRCKTELLFRLVDEWFINMKWRDEIIAVTEQATFLPESINGQAKERNWLENMHDWMISKKRFWGLALPIWVDEGSGDFEVIGSYQELKERAVEGWDRFEGHTPHRPWVDLVKIRNPKTGNLMSRIADVGNPWLDAGIVPYSTMGYNTDRAYWEKWFPADFIVESFPGQFRNWFYAILAMSTMMTNRPPFKVLLGHGTVRDQNGETMSKTKGNSIEFNGAADSGYELFVDRNPKLKVEDQAKKELPAGYLSSYEDEVVIEGKPKKVVKGKYHPIGADVIRWLYCRHNPALNLNIGPGPTDEIRSSFVLKLWNAYAFFCNYARLDGFDPTAALVPLARRPDIDRWILSDLQKLIRTARKAFEAYNVMAFCLEAERFVDDKLSNWYIRRNRRRFWKGEQGEDKQAAYQTLYTVLVTLTKLFAPIMPFLTESMYQNLVVKAAGGGPASVHLCDYPTAHDSLVDERLSEDMEALLRVVTLGSAARNVKKIKVRQPLAELRIQPGHEAARRAVERFGDQIQEELNVKAVHLHDPAGGPLLAQETKPNMKTLGGKFKAQLQQVVEAIGASPPAELAAKVQKGELFHLGPFALLPEDVVVSSRAPEGWVGLEERGTQVALDARITEELAGEGRARDVVRQVQDLRKEAGLEMEDRIVLYLGTDWEPLQQAIDAHRDYIAGETLATSWAPGPLDGQGQGKKVKIEGKELTIELARAGG